jgi:hypothetical protein
MNFMAIPKVLHFIIVCLGSFCVSMYDVYLQNLGDKNVVSFHNMSTSMNKRNDPQFAWGLKYTKVGQKHSSKM